MTDAEPSGSMTTLGCGTRIGFRCDGLLQIAHHEHARQQPGRQDWEIPRSTVTMPLDGSTVTS